MSTKHNVVSVQVLSKMFESTEGVEKEAPGFHWRRGWNDGMNDQLQEQLARILSAIQVATKAGADFALEQLPDIAQQYLLFGRVKYSVLFGLSVTLFSVLIFITFRYGFFKKKSTSPGVIPG